MKFTLGGTAASLSLTALALGGLGLAACAGKQNPSTASASTGTKPVANVSSAAPAAPSKTLTGREAFGDWSTDVPGTRRKITVADLPAPFETKSSDNGPGFAPRPDGAMPKAPAGFTVSEFKSGLAHPRVIVTAPNGDIFVAESEPARGVPGNIKVLRDTDGDGKADTTTDFATGLKQPFGIAFYPSGRNPKYVYIAQTDSVLRYPYQNGDTTARGAAETITDQVPGGGRLRGGGHWTRDIVFSKDDKTLFLSIGSASNVDERNDPQEEHRARIFAMDPDGKNMRNYATGIRNPVGLAIQPGTGTLWTSVNERDGLGDHLVPDYITSVKEGGFYGWPWFYLGDNQDPRHPGEHPELKGKVTVPDVLLQSHSASLDLTFYTGSQFPSEYKNNIFASEHGSWNRARRTGYKVVRVPMNGNKATGEYEDFLTGFVVDDGHVWGRPVGVTVARDGALLVSDDGSSTIWRVAYTGNTKKTAQR